MIVRRRPAESAGLAGAAALLTGRLLGIKDADTLTALGVVIASVPSAVTWLVSLVRTGGGGPGTPTTRP